MALRIVLLLLLQFVGAAYAGDPSTLCFLVGRDWTMAVSPDGSGTLYERGMSHYSQSLPKGSFDYAGLVEEVDRLEQKGKPNGGGVRYYFANYDSVRSTEIGLSPKLRGFFRQAEKKLREQGDRILNALLDRRPLDPGSP